MSDLYKERASESPFVYSFAWGFCESPGALVMPADCHCHLFVGKQNGKINLAVGGPMTKVLAAPYEAGAECFRMWFTDGTFMPQLSTRTLVDNVVFLPEATSRSFWLNGSAWEFPNFENAESFVNRLVREELLICDPIINSVLSDQPQDMSFSTVRRRFLRATGLTPGTLRQIKRVHQAVALLKRGVSILDTVYEVGYFDQPHLTRSLKHFIGQTPGQIARIHQSR